MSAASLVLLAIVLLFVALAILVALLTCAACAADDGRRAVDVPQFGIATRAPLAWTLIEWGREDLAFVLRLPQERGSPPGSVSCQLEFADGTLDEWRRQRLAVESEPKETRPLAKVVRDEIEQLDPQKFESLATQKIAERWVRLSESSSTRGRKTFELTNHMLYGGIVYAFTLRTDEEHFDAYRADFDDLSRSRAVSRADPGAGPAARRILAAARLRICPLAARRVSSRRSRGKIRTQSHPTRRPADDKVSAAEVLLLATGELALDLDALRAKLPAEIVAADPQARVDHCQIVVQGQMRALETVVYTRRGEQPIATFTRQFRGQDRNFELRAICPADEFEANAANWRRVAESVREVEAKKPGELL